jgi:hypothetical protein
MSSDTRRMRFSLGSLAVVALASSACSEAPVAPADSGRSDGAGSMDGGLDGFGAGDGAVGDAATIDGSMSDGAGGEGGVGPLCATPEACEGDTRCVMGRCVPWGEGSSDTMCSTELRPGVFAPTVQCEFKTAPMGDMFPNHTHVFGAVVVGDLAPRTRDPDSGPRPSIVAIFDPGTHMDPVSQTGVIRVLDGRTCALQATLGEQRVIASSSPAIADLDNDGLVEIIAIKAGGGLVAYTQSAPGTWRIYWRSNNMGMPYEVSGGWWTSPTVIDLDDDGFPEVLRNGIVFDGRTGALIGGAAASAGLASYDPRGLGGLGAHTVVLDVDEDGEVELVDGNRVFQWNRAMRNWVPETYRPASGAVGHVAVGNMGAFTSMRFMDDAIPEVVVVSNGAARIETLEGRVVFGPVSIPGGFGGPPTIADFDGDGLAEFASAGGTQYMVFDPDCTASPRPGGDCITGTTNGVLWTRPSQDSSSAVTGSTSFDFEGDGRVEAVYADECFLRVYEGRSGNVLYSAPHASCTWYENPIVADVDGDFRAEIVMGSNHLCGTIGVGRACAGLGPRNTDPLFPGLRCRANDDCTSGSCVEGLCRCTMDAQCCAGGGATCDFVCAAPPMGTPGMGNTCRASRERGPNGVRVFSDVMDRWVGSRPVWNQHAYHVTNIEDNLRVARTSMARRGWRTAGLNNFRTNVQGRAGMIGVADATAQGASWSCEADNTAILRARVCNRGAAPISDTVSVGFYNGEPGAMSTMRLCAAPLGRTLNPGACAEVTCRWPGAGMTAMPVDVRVRVDDDNAVRECREQNNRAVISRVVCPMIG